jgi:hypothetical protein
LRSRGQGTSAGAILDRGNAGTGAADLYDTAEHLDDRRASVT